MNAVAKALDLHVADPNSISRPAYGPTNTTTSGPGTWPDVWGRKSKKIYFAAQRELQKIIWLITIIFSHWG